jgi:capsid assembly protease
MPNYLALIAERVINQPLMILPEKLAIVALVLEGRINLDASDMKDTSTAIVVDGVELQLDGVRPDASRYVGEFRPKEPGNPKAGYKPYRMTPEGNAIIPVHGSLVNRGGFLDALSGVTSYEKLRHQINAAREDSDVMSTLVHIDSGGGEAIGAFETGDTVSQHATTKPIYAVADGLCCSAAYAIASGASRIITSRSSLTGSIGTAMLHLDRSKQLADMGVKPTLFVTGRRKGDGSPFFELSDEVKGELRSYINRVNQNFLDLVANHRGVTAERLLALEAGVFIGAEAIAHGLVDEVGSFETALSELQGAPRPRKLLENRTMSEKTYTQAELDAAVTTAKADGHKGGVEAGRKEGVTAERGRVKAVMTSETYKGREASANHMLHNTDMSAEDIGGVLSGITVATPVSGTAQLLPADRAQSQEGGLVVEGAQGQDKKPAPANDFEKGREIAARLPASLRAK